MQPLYIRDMNMPTVFTDLPGFAKPKLSARSAFRRAAILTAGAVIIAGAGTYGFKLYEGMTTFAAINQPEMQRISLIRNDWLIKAFPKFRPYRAAWPKALNI